VKRSGRNEPMWIAIHKCMEGGNLKEKKAPCVGIWLVREYLPLFS
jgi:hypothetical protein